MEKFNQAEFERKAKKMVASYYDIDEKEVFMVWFSKVGSNAKAMLNISDDPEFNYFNVTYFGEKGQYIMTVHTYVDDEELRLNEKQKNCPYCHSEKAIFQLRDELQVYISNGLNNQSLALVYDFSDKALTDEEFMNVPFGRLLNSKIKFCPMCGRDLVNNSRKWWVTNATQI